VRKQGTAVQNRKTIRAGEGQGRINEANKLENKIPLESVRQIWGGVKHSRGNCPNNQKSGKNLNRLIAPKG